MGSITTPPPPRRIKLGILTPSSNTALEPLTSALITSINASLRSSPPTIISVHYSRFPVLKISLDSSGLAQFDRSPILAAAELLAHAEVDMIGWSGTSSGWLGFDEDVSLCSEIERVTGVKATTSVLELNRALELWGVKRLGLVTPYTDDVQAKIVGNYESAGWVVGSRERHLGVKKNSDFSRITEDTLDGMMEEVVGSKGAGQVDVVSTFCTNLSAAHRVAYWEKRYGVPVFDTVTTVVWGMLRELGIEVTDVEGWGMIFSKC